MRIIALFISGYGVYALVKRQFIDYMFLKTQFVFFDFGEPLFLFLIDYLAIMGPVSYTHLDVYKRQDVGLRYYIRFIIGTSIRPGFPSLSVSLNMYGE